MRSLNIVPIVHSTHDLGRLKDSILADKTALNSGLFESSSTHTVDWFWDELQRAIRSWNWAFSNVYVYQDALPVGQDDSGLLEKKIISDLAWQGNPNYQTLEWLVESGANVIGTEDPALLLEEYQLVQRALKNRQSEHAEVGLLAESLLEKRDTFIANRVQQTLPINGTGLLFLGMLHRVEDFLPNDIQVDYPFGRPKKDSVTVRKTY